MRTTDSASRGRPLLQRLSTGTQLILLLAVALIAIVMLWYSSSLQPQAHEATRRFLESTASGLLVSAAFGLAQTAVTGRVTTEILRESVVSELRQSLATSSARYYPTHDFPATASPNPTFNHLLAKDLDQSPSYWFQGISGRHTASRLSKSRAVNLEVHLILPDLTFAQSLQPRISYSIRHGLEGSATPEAIRKKLERNVMVGLVALFDVRFHCSSIEVSLSPIPALNRVEIFRDSIWLTLFSEVDQGAIYPRSLRFSSRSLLYNTAFTECQQIRDFAGERRWVLDRQWSDTEFSTCFKEMTGETLTPDLLAEFREESSSFRRVA